jgi:hypothetical protein
MPKGLLINVYQLASVTAASKQATTLLENTDT